MNNEENTKIHRIVPFGLFSMFRISKCGTGYLGQR
jgi:hypothetical protein